MTEERSRQGRPSELKDPVEVSSHYEREQLTRINAVVAAARYRSRAEWLREAAEEKLARGPGAPGSGRTAATVADITPGSRWLARGKAPYRNWRRIVEVTSADPHGFVEAVGWWQERLNGAWVDADYPGARRKTRVRAAAFVQKYTPVPPGEEKLARPQSCPAHGPHPHASELGAPRRCLDCPACVGTEKGEK